MARAIRGLDPIYYILASLPEVDVERLKKDSLRVYLQNRLRHLEARISTLSHQHADMEEDWQHLYWGEESTEELWNNLLELDYLEATREAIIEALEAL
ncbi:MAG: hypothetical protein OEW09_05340 [Anaerolineae bacterium]|nr:hypothetical protein [Anaerolineae bacterium]